MTDRAIHDDPIPVEQELTPSERARYRVRLVVYAAMLTGATRAEILAEVSRAFALASRKVTLRR
jgi:hypothetical protein